MMIVDSGLLFFGPPCIWRAVELCINDGAAMSEVNVI